MSSPFEDLFLLRAVRPDDLPALQEFAHTKSLPTLPEDIPQLKHKIELSTASFHKKLPEGPRDEFYLFILEDVTTKKAVGCSGVVSRIGTEQPFYAYQIDAITLRCPSLNITKVQELLQLRVMMRGPAELCSLYLNPSYRKGGLGRLLSLGRFLFLASFIERFPSMIVAEMLGNIQNGTNAFWEAVGARFLDMDLTTANYLHFQDQNFVSDLLPQFPIYLCLISKEARETLGQTHPDTVPAYHLLLKEGFTYTGEVDLFDGGPNIYGEIKNLRSVRESIVAPFGGTLPEWEHNKPFLVSVVDIDYRATLSPLTVSSNGAIFLPPPIAEILRIKKGDLLRYVRVL